MNGYQAEQFDLLRRIARERGGWCVSERYVNSKTKMRWRCRHDHVWLATSQSIKRGTWCQACARLRPLGILAMRELAAERGGKCLSRRYESIANHLRWECGACGQQWSATPNNVLAGAWCPRCSPRPPGSIERMRELAAAHGGECLSEEYVNGETPLEWTCSHGHRWWTTPNSIKNRAWCPFCAGAVKPTLRALRRVARDRGGELLSGEYVDGETKLRWRCREGHEWEAAWANVRTGTWCGRCKAGGRGKRKPRLGIDDMRAVARERGGRCLSEAYVNTKTPLLWECARGHRWEQRQSPIRRGSWCPHCAGVVRGSLEDLVELARQRGGRCLSSAYGGVDAPHRWRCATGHEWEAVPKNVKRGTWCPTCAGHQRLTLADMQALAAARGGRCLSDSYRSNAVHLLWECKRGHRWEAVGGSVRAGTWCPICYREDRKRETKRRRRPRGGAP